MITDRFVLKSIGLGWLEETGIQHPTRRRALAGKTRNQCTMLVKMKMAKKSQFV